MINLISASTTPLSLPIILWTANIAIRPCCTQINGTCEIRSQREPWGVRRVGNCLSQPARQTMYHFAEYCDFVEGYWNTNGETCSEINCLEHTCGQKLKLKVCRCDWRVG